MAASLVDRIGAEVDKRVDARLAQRRQPSAEPGAAAEPGAGEPARSHWPPVVLALGSMLVGLLTLLAATKNEGQAGAAVLIIVVWAAIAAINVAYARRR